MSIMAQSLEDMAEELTCPICLSHFSTPVSTPCGHNFCADCLELTWSTGGGKEYSCPQCRCTFDRKPELMKNTTLSNLVSKIMEAKGESLDPSEDIIVEEQEMEEKCEVEDLVQCDLCMKLPAAKTCLTCMASFCQEHLQPHLESLAFRDHQLRQPITDLHLRKCMNHGKILDNYCWDHSLCICCYCLAEHKQCKTQSLQDTKTSKELELKQLLRLMTQKISKAANTDKEVKRDETKVMEKTKKKKELLGGEYEEIKALIQAEERNAMSKIEEEEKKVQNKFNYTHNIIIRKQQEFETFKKKIESVLQENDDLEFLKRAAKLKDTTSKDAFKPKIEFDEILMQKVYKNTTSLKELIKYKLEYPDQTPEWRKQLPSFSSENESEFQKDETAGWKPYHQASSASPRQEAEFKKERFPEEKTGIHGTKKYPEKEKTRSRPKSKKTPAEAAAAAPPPPPPPPPGVPSPRREDLLKYAVHLTVDINTAHKKVSLSHNNTKLTVSNTNQDYRDHPQRFTHCSQALCTTGFPNSVHYWEIEIEGGNFSGIGVAYGSIARTGTESRLGRNKTSWCIEWFNGKLQAWHNDKQTDLTSPNTNKIGVLLNCDEGFVSFFSVAKKFSLIYKFRARFTEPVYPAFWVFSNITTLHITPFY